MTQGPESSPFTPHQYAALKKEWERINRRAENAKERGIRGIGRIAVGNQITTSFLVKPNGPNEQGRNETVTAVFGGRNNDGSFIFTPPQPQAPRAPAAQRLMDVKGPFGPNNNQSFGPMGSSSWPEPQPQPYNQPPSRPPEPRADDYEGPYYYSVMRDAFNKPQGAAGAEATHEQPSAATPDELRQRDPEATDVYPVDIQGPATTGEKPAEVVEPPEVAPYVPQGDSVTQSVIGEELKPERPVPEAQQAQHWPGHDRKTVHDDQWARDAMQNGPGDFYYQG